MAFEEEKILLKSKLCTQESFIVWCRSRFLLYNVIKELNCKDLLSFDLLGVLHSCTLLPMQIASEQSKVRSRKLDLLPEKILTNIGKYWKTLNNTEIYLKALKKNRKNARECWCKLLRSSRRSKAESWICCRKIWICLEFHLKSGFQGIKLAAMPFFTSSINNKLSTTYTISRLVQNKTR